MTPRIGKTFLAAVVCAALAWGAAPARAQGWDPVSTSDIEGIHLWYRSTLPTDLTVWDPTQWTEGLIPDNGAGYYTLTLDDNAWFKLANDPDPHGIVNVYGFFELFNTDPGDPRVGNTVGWAEKPKEGTQFAGYYGWWNSNKTYALYAPGETSNQWNKGSLHDSSDASKLGYFYYDGTTVPDYFGLHITTDDAIWGGGYTGWIYLKDPPSQVPEPAFVQLGGLLALGGLAFWKFRPRTA